MTAKRSSGDNAMTQTLGNITLLVRDYDEAIAYYTTVLGFILLEHTALGGGSRWVRVAPPGPGGTAVLLALANTDNPAERVGDQTGGRVGFFLHTDDFAGDFAAMTARGVRFLEAPRTEKNGMAAAFEDLYGNRWDLLELRE